MIGEPETQAFEDTSDPGTVRAERARAAETELRAILDEDPACLEAYLLLGSLYRDRGENALAAAAFRAVLEICPRHPRAWDELRTLPLGNIAS
jgi:cytochrome c-type biogenesis protein CcmH/NrfG